MKQPGDIQKIEEDLRDSKIVAGGFMGDETRSLSEIIDADNAELAGLNITAKQLAEKMQKITDQAKTALGEWVMIGKNINAKTDEAKGILTCPWPHTGKFDKRVTTVKKTDTGQTIFWSDLNIHLIAEHAFFEGKGSPFRLEPTKLAEFFKNFLLPA